MHKYDMITYTVYFMFGNCLGEAVCNRLRFGIDDRFIVSSI